MTRGFEKNYWRLEELLEVLRRIMDDWREVPIIQNEKNYG